MTEHYNKKSEQEKRRNLRNDMTYCERVIWLHLRKKQLGYRFLRQYSVDHFVIDFYCPKLKLAIEIDGGIHEDPYQRRYDLIRQKYLENYGITFLRIKNEEFLGNPNRCFKRISEAIKDLKK